ncbi:hypothetical protein FO519_009762 [Halicephalobus sp. NKZ332]|nr:hypothetical protein FO519_009762 [Halicephalobus sp. NKZ332]
MSDLIPKRGDLLVFNSVGYCHWAVYIGNNKVIHVTAAHSDKFSLESIINALIDKASKAVVKEEELEMLNFVIRFTHVDNSLDSQIPPFSPDEIVRRARSKIGSWYYDLERNNCEHFAKWCRYGEEVCQQLVYAYDTGDSAGAGLGSYTLGPARYHLPSVHGKAVDEEGRKEIQIGAQVAGAELSFIKANVGASGKFGVRNNDSGIGVTAETKFVETRAGPVSTQLGLGVSTGAHADENGVGAEILGTGAYIASIFEKNTSFFTECFSTRTSEKFTSLNDSVFNDDSDSEPDDLRSDDCEVIWYAVRVIISGHGIVYHEQFMTADGAQGFVNKKSRELTNGTHW